MKCLCPYVRIDCVPFGYGRIYELTDASMHDVAGPTQGWHAVSESGSVTAALRPCHCTERSADELSLSL